MLEPGLDYLVFKAFWANPELYDRIPIQIRTAGQNVHIEIAGINYTATPAASDPRRGQRSTLAEACR